MVTFSGDIAKSWPRVPGCADRHALMSCMRDIACAVPAVMINARACSASGQEGKFCQVSRKHWHVGVEQCGSLKVG